MSRQLTDILFRDRLITQSQYDQAIQGAPKMNGSPIRFLIQNKVISENKLVEYLSRKYNLPSINLSKYDIDKKIIGVIPVDLVKDHKMIPIQTKGDTVVVAVCDPTVLSTVDKVKFVAKKNIEAVLTSYSAFDEAMGKHYGATAVIATALSALKNPEATRAMAKPGQGGKKDAPEPPSTPSSGMDQFEVHNIDDVPSGNIEQGEAVIAFVNGILGEAIRRGASDIHVEPYEKRFRVRLRVDGALHEIAEIPTEMKRSVVARMKIMSRMDIGETRVPQDGRIKLSAAGKMIDFRVNTLPTLFGEKVVLRMLSSGNLTLDLRKMGFEKKQLDDFMKGIYAPNGMVLVTGPTGSGKTTTLYSALAELNQITDNISTCEDPVEYNLEGVNQTQVNKEVGLTFASVLRALLRQDPDTILVGEIRDYETAEVSIQAALTGHLVLSTLHTNDAPSTITRLMNMGVEPFLVTSAVNTIVAQRLLRRVCTKCKQNAPVPLEKLLELGVSKEAAAGARLSEGKGCTVCNNSGYKGRCAVYEVLDFTQDLKEMVIKGESIIDIKKKAVANGMTNLRDAAINRALDGTTSLKEALSMTMDEH